jgi:hypothetical protein
LGKPPGDLLGPEDEWTVAHGPRERTLSDLENPKGMLEHHCGALLNVCDAAPSVAPLLMQRTPRHQPRVLIKAMLLL